MENENETLADVLAEMRKEIGDGTDTYLGMRIIRRMEDTRVRHYCDRIAAASRRDERRAVEHATRHAEAVARDNCHYCMHNPHGPNYEGDNAAKMREALLKCRDIALQWQADEAAGVAGTTDKPEARSASEAVIDMEFEINAALFAPPRNCDVGTAEEQAERYGRYCDTFTSDGMHCENCPCCGKIPFGKCEFAWAQMPYEREGGAE